MRWQHIRIARFGGPEVLELAERATIPDPGPGEVRIKVLAAGTGFTDTFIRRGRYPDFKGPLPFTPGYDVVGVVEKIGGAGLASAALGLARLKLWNALSGLFGGRRAVFYNITSRRLAHPEDFKADMVTLFDLLRDRAIHPVVIDRLPLSAARDVHSRIDLGGLGGKIVLLPWPEA
jgi:NADPH:quinone reductase-like Zn-dependent oxidoreductase